MRDPVVRRFIEASEAAVMAAAEPGSPAETVAREAQEKAWPLPAYCQHLIVHGTLHLLGYDHEEGEAEAEHLEALERAACTVLGLPDPYEG